MRVLICGSRNWNDSNIICAVLDGLYFQAIVGHLTVEMSEFVLIEGGAPGADTHAKWWAKNSPTHSYNENPDDPHFEHLQFPAEWKRYGKAAGSIRNSIMLIEGKPDVVCAFKDRFDWTFSAGGTEDMVKRAKAASIPCYVVGRA